MFTQQFSLRFLTETFKASLKEGLIRDPHIALVGFRLCSLICIDKLHLHHDHILLYLRMGDADRACPHEKVQRSPTDLILVRMFCIVSYWASVLIC